jgi:hypothetical protein
MRAMMSVPPPGEAPTMIFTGFVGQAPCAAQSAASVTSIEPRRAFHFIFDLAMSLSAPFTMMA